MIYRIEHNEYDGTGKTRLTFSDDKLGHLGPNTNVNCGFLIENGPYGLVCAARASFRDPAFEGKAGYGGLGSASHDSYYISILAGFGYNPSNNISDIADNLYGFEWHARRSFLPDDDRLELMRLIRFEVRHLFPVIFDEALALVPKYDRYNYPGMSADSHNIYLEYDATHSDAVDDTI